jgi:hypothetical protein
MSTSLYARVHAQFPLFQEYPTKYQKSKRSKDQKIIKRLKDQKINKRSNDQCQVRESFFKNADKITRKVKLSHVGEQAENLVGVEHRMGD